MLYHRLLRLRSLILFISFIINELFFYSSIKCAIGILKITNQLHNSYSYIYSVGTKLTKYHNETVILNYEDKRNLQLQKRV